MLTSGRAEGGPNRPAPALSVIAIDPDGPAPRLLGRVDFDRHDDDPERLAVSDSGNTVAVTFLGSEQVATINLTDPEHPRLNGRVKRTGPGEIQPMWVEGKDLLPGLTARRGDSVLVRLPDGRSDCVACVRPWESSIELFACQTASSPPSPLGRLPLRGAWNLGPTQPMGIAHSPERDLLAVATRSGSVHLIEVRSIEGDGSERRSPAIATGPGDAGRR